jgi:hypothetical protein
MKPAPRIVRLACIASAALMVVPLAPALAQGFGPLRYDFVSTHLVVTELDELGIELAGQTAVTERIVVAGTYQSWDPSERVERDTLKIGVGYIFGVRPNVDFVASVHYADNEIDSPGRPRFDEEGIILSGLVRGWLTQRIELSGEILLDNSIGSSTETVLELGAQFMREANVSYGGRLRLDEEDTAIFVGARFYFGASRRR